MNRVLILCTLVSLAIAGVIPEEAQAQIVKYESSNDGTGNYKYSYETSNGIIRQESGYLVNAGTETEHMVVQGSYSYTDVDGKLVLIKYTADENGFHVGPPTPLTEQVSVISALPPSVTASLLGK